MFATPLGHCGIAWSPRGVAGLQLPESRDAVTRARLLRRHPDAREAGPPAAVQSGVDAILDLLGGEANDLS